MRDSDTRNLSDWVNIANRVWDRIGHDWNAFTSVVYLDRAMFMLSESPFFAQMWTLRKTSKPGYPVQNVFIVWLFVIQLLGYFDIISNKSIDKFLVVT